MYRRALLLAIAAASLSAQTPVTTIIGAGYTAPLPIPAAPGQIVTLFVSGIAFPASQPAFAPAGPLPTTLGGLIVTLLQGSAATPVPIFQVSAVSSCYGASYSPACTQITAVTVQIPFEVDVPCRLCASPIAVAPAYLSVSPTCSAHPSMFAPTCTAQPLSILDPSPDRIHIVTSCDSILSPGSSQIPPCPPLVTHGNGSLVTETAPAHPGEELIAYATGLGQTNPPSLTGRPAASSAPTFVTLVTDFNFHPNALPSKPVPPGAQPPLYSGTTPGFTGLYQINFVVPPSPPPPLCATAQASCRI